MSDLRYARVAVNVAQVSGLYDYRLPGALMGTLQSGSLVTVPFGRQTVQGIVIQLVDDPAVADPKTILSLLDDTPVVTQSQMTMAQWMAEENLSSLAACLGLMLPPGVMQHADIVLRLLDQSETSDLTPVQKHIVNLLNKRGDLRGSQLDRSLPNTDWRKSLPGLLKRGWVSSTPFLAEPSVKAKTAVSVSFVHPPLTEEEIHALGKPDSPIRERRERILDFLASEKSGARLPLLLAETAAKPGDLSVLEKAGLIRVERVEIRRDPLGQLHPVTQNALHLTVEQNAVIDALLGQIHTKEPAKPNLLQGVTSSGKTEVYLRAVEEVLKTGRQAIILVPEISLTPQTVSRFVARFPGKVALIHSQLSPGERYDTWRRIRAGELQVVVGARSALFAPIPNPGLIVIDECHDGSYHQEEFQPHYHAVATAMYYAQNTGAILVLGSATPSVEQTWLFRQGKWNVFKLAKRVAAHQAFQPDKDAGIMGDLPLPKIEIVDMRRELGAGNRSVLSRALAEGLDQVLQEGNQAILFLNRRGSSSYVFCRDCGYVLRCTRCNLPMTYHASQTLLICHHCNTQRRMPEKCPQCQSVRIKQFGLGTESLQKMIEEQFPQARVLRWDADTSSKKGAHDLIMETFVQQRADIMIGTQMIAKGLDLPKVTLVGLVLADVSLNLPDFRAAERTFQLITQVAGRAGRSPLGGKVILQTFMPEHYAIRRAADYDFDGFETVELEQRKIIAYPPFGRLTRIELRHPDLQVVRETSERISEQIKKVLHERNLDPSAVIGAVPCYFQRISGFYRWHILLLGEPALKVLRELPLASLLPSAVKLDVIVDASHLL